MDEEAALNINGILKESAALEPKGKLKLNVNGIKSMEAKEVCFALSPEVELILSIYSSFNEIFWFRY